MIIDASHKTVADVCRSVHPDCVVCSCANSRGLQLKFDVLEDKTVRADFQCDKAFEGYPGILHGGVISSVLDGAMGNCLFSRGLTAVTVEIKVKFRQAVLLDRTATVSARVKRQCHPLYLLEAEIVQDGALKALAEGKFYDQPKFRE